MAALPDEQRDRVLGRRVGRTDAHAFNEERADAISTLFAYVRDTLWMATTKESALIVEKRRTKERALSFSIDHYTTRRALKDSAKAPAPIWLSSTAPKYDALVISVVIWWYLLVELTSKITIYKQNEIKNGFKYIIKNGINYKITNDRIYSK